MLPKLLRPQSFIPALFNIMASGKIISRRGQPFLEINRKIKFNVENHYQVVVVVLYTIVVVAENYSYDHDGGLGHPLICFSLLNDFKQYLVLFLCKFVLFFAYIHNSHTWKCLLLVRTSPFVLACTHSCTCFYWNIFWLGTSLFCCTRTCRRFCSSWKIIVCLWWWSCLI